MVGRPWLWAIASAVLATFLVGLTTIGPRAAPAQRAIEAGETEALAPPPAASRPAAATKGSSLPLSARRAELGSERTSETALPPDVQARARTQALVRSIAQLARDHLYESPAGQQLRGCVPQASVRCAELLSSALYEALAQHVEPALQDGTLDAAQLNGLDPERVHDAISGVLESSGDAIERVSALVLLDRSPQLPPGALPPGAYRELSQKPVVEAQLLLTRSVLAGLPDEGIAREVSFLASSAHVDSRVQGAALEALARASHGPQLAEAVRALAAQRDPSWSGWEESVAPALGRCGLACADAAVLVVAQAPDPSAAASQVMRLELLATKGTELTSSLFEQVNVLTPSPLVEPLRAQAATSTVRASRRDRSSSCR
jgi:hypothetical protein